MGSWHRGESPCAAHNIVPKLHSDLVSCLHREAIPGRGNLWGIIIAATYGNRPVGQHPHGADTYLSRAVHRGFDCSPSNQNERRNGPAFICLDAVVAANSFGLYPLELSTGEALELSLRRTAGILQLPHVDLRDVDAKHAHDLSDIDLR